MVRGLGQGLSVTPTASPKACFRWFDLMLLWAQTVDEAVQVGVQLGVADTHMTVV